MAIVITQEPTKVWKGSWLTRLIQQTTALLKEMQATPGVRSAFVCDNYGRPLGALTSESPDKGMLERAGLSAAQIFAALDKPARPKELEIRFEHTVVLLRDLGNAFQVVLCAPTANLAMLRMALNVAAAPFEKALDLQVALKTAAEARADTLTDKHLDAQALQWAQQLTGAR